MRRAVAAGVMPYHESDDHHPNGRGYEVIASAINPTLRSLLGSSGASR
jgi:hypothetical protein